MLWESDFPHPESSWPESQAVTAKYLAGVPDDEVAKITHVNAVPHLPVGRRVTRAKVVIWGPGRLGGFVLRLLLLRPDEFEVVGVLAVLGDEGGARRR